MTVEGIAVEPENTPILIPQGWSFLGYLRTISAYIDTLLLPIVADVIIVKNTPGQIYWPQWGLNAIGEMIPGEGYQIKLVAQDTLIYPPNYIPSIFTCGDTISDFDGNLYNTVFIGSQCWMKENLKTTHYADGTAMVDGTFAGNFDGDYTSKYYFDYDNNPTNTAIYGKLYTYAAVTNGIASCNTLPSGVQGICPNRWHVPSDEEWKILEGNVDSQYGYPNAEWDGTGYRGFDACENLKSTTNWDNNGNGTDLFGFSAFPGGYRNSYGYFIWLGPNGFWWSACEYSTTTAWYRGLYFDYDSVGRNATIKSYGFSVRCLRDSIASQANLPTVTTPTITNITQTTAIGSSVVTNDGGAAVSEHGLCWNTTGSPTLADSFVVAGSGTGTFTAPLTNLLPDSIYFVRAFATNAVGTAYWNEAQFSTLSAFICGTQVSDFDGNTYNTVLIGNQCWMKENLKTTHYADGTPLVDGTNAGDISGNYTTKYYFDYNNDSTNTAIYGKLYTWAAVMNGTAASNTVPSGVQGICPVVWHVPSDEEWKILEGAVDSLYGYPDAVWDNTGWRGYDAGKNLKTTSGWDFNTGTDMYGFSALPGGSRSSNSYFFYEGFYGFWWSSSVASGAWIRQMYDFNDNVRRTTYNKSVGVSVRCLKN